MKDTQVLIAGAGPAGLMSALLLARAGVRATVIERRPSMSVHPKARGLNLRTMEILRALGLEQAVLTAGADLAKNKFMLFVETLAGREIRRIPDDDLMLKGELLRQWTPCTWTQCSQDTLEKVLAEAAVQGGAEICFCAQLTAFTEDDGNVSCTVRDRSSETDREIRARYLLACDGSDSFVRRALRIPLEGRSAIEHFVNIYFRAELKDLVQGRWFGICFVENPKVRGLFLPVDNDSRWLLNVQFDPEVTSSETFTKEKCLELVCAAVGDSGLDVEILSAIPWQASALVAPRLREGRVFLVGDSGHIMPPAGAYGLNTAVQDAHNLAWKLAAVLKGEAGEVLLDSYEQERLPIAAELAREAERAMDAPNPWESGEGNGPAAEAGSEPVWGGPEHAEDGDGQGSSPWDQPLEEQVRVVIGFQYRSGAVAEGERLEGLELRCQPGTRFPHAWLSDGRSTLDLLVSGFSAVVAEGAVIPVSIPASVHVVRLPEPAWAEVKPSTESELVLVRPDGVVAEHGRLSELKEMLSAATGMHAHAIAS
ncbi:FAD-dependent monooxygenase [Occallatibacter savannae]|uniref:FAD-dependent monooxygenase n=1 Tax=Occallatibacter savannae TaxID=1002691 RepID=UPI000D68DE50|nr:FAD-dependent monooxygenase [Occallatibacter savannae]